MAKMPRNSKDKKAAEKEVATNADVDTSSDPEDPTDDNSSTGSQMSELGRQ